ncbi:hypothetical protein [Crenothrix sp.]|uniref:hypothetical protein n=1 Tax=Crenothrix sp. TaxID=3100433 RepID=UPI00374CDCFC
MPYRKISDRECVIQAINEFTELGQVAFLGKYKGGRALRYFLLYEGQQYNCRSILCAAYAHQFKHPIPRRQMNDPKNSISDVLKRLGFDVLDNRADNVTSGVFKDMPH